MAKKLTSGKAKRMLKDNSAKGHSLTPKQKRYFGYVAGGGKPKKPNGGSIANNVIPPQQQNWYNQSSGRADYIPIESALVPIAPEFRLGQTMGNVGKTLIRDANGELKWVDNIIHDLGDASEYKQVGAPSLKSLSYENKNWYKESGGMTKEEINKARKKPGGSNVGKKTFANGSKRHGPYAGPSGGAPKGSFPISDINHARAALALAHHAPNPSGIKAAVYKKYPELKKEFGGNVITSKSNDMEKLDKKNPLHKRLLKFGGILKKADNGLNLNPSPGNYQWGQQDYGYRQDNNQGNMEGQDQYLYSPTNPYGGVNIQQPQNNYTLPPQGYNFSQGNVAGGNITYGDPSKMVNNSTTTPGVNLSGPKNGYDFSGNNKYQVDNQQQAKKDNKLQKGWNSANYTDIFGHSSNYWADFAQGAWKATDALTHAIPDTIGDFKSNRYNEANEMNNDKRIQNPFQSMKGGMGYGQTLRKFGGKISDYKADGGNNVDPNVEIEGGEQVQLPNGMNQTAQGPSHSMGGIPMSLPEGTKIFSERLKDPETKKSYAKLAKKFDTSKEQKILDDTKADKIAKETAKMQMDRKNQEADALFLQMEQNKLKGLHGKDVQKQTMEDYAPQMQAANGAWIPTLPVMSLFEHEKANGGYIPTLETMALFEKANMEKGGWIPPLEVMQLFERQKYGNGGLKQYSGENGSSQVDNAPVVTYPYADRDDNNPYRLDWNIPTGKQKTSTGVEYGKGTNNYIAPEQWDDINKAWTNIARQNGALDKNEYFKSPKELQEYMYDYTLDNLNKGGREALQQMWGHTGLTDRGLTQSPNYAKKDFSNLSDQDLKDLRDAFIDNKADFRYFLPAGQKLSPLSVNNTSSQEQKQNGPYTTTQGTYNTDNTGIRGRFGMLPTVVGIPNPQLDAAVNFRHINPNPINYRPENNLGEINEIQSATANLSRFLPATSEGIGLAANMQANAAGKIGESNEKLYNLNQRGRFQVDEANQRNLQGVNEFNAKNDLEQLNHITGREFGKSQQSIQDRKEALNQINTNNQFANTADFLGRTIDPLNYYGGKWSPDTTQRYTGNPSDDDEYYKEVGKRVIKNLYGYPAGSTKLTNVGKEETTEKPETQKYGGKVNKRKIKADISKLKNVKKKAK